MIITNLIQRQQSISNSKNNKRSRLKRSSIMRHKKLEVGERSINQTSSGRKNFHNFINVPLLTEANRVNQSNTLKRDVVTTATTTAKTSQIRAIQRSKSSLTDDIDGKKIEVDDSMKNHGGSDDTTLRRAMVAAYNKVKYNDKNVEDQGDGVYRVKNLDGGYTVLKLKSGSVKFFHWHKNYKLDNN